ncbi:MAG: aldolase catalytic domain-containing protein [FCB group bacterium]|jgi:4-hydroxy 2-oxovalerate aldolase|nr:aldolase catalytic domain-containing protein [FCB group bacterium]
METSSAPWVTYIPELKVLDCTVRDGGLINNHQFDDAFVRAVYETCVEAGIDYMEIGYKGSEEFFSREKFGPWKFCREEDLRRVIGDNPTDLKIAVMADAGKTDWREDIGPKSESVIDAIRVACYIHQIPEALDMIAHAHEQGYEVSCNVMAISTVQDAEIDAALKLLRSSAAQTVVVVDSFGSLNPEQVRMLVERYKNALKGTGKEIGIHAHNNMQLAFANTIESIIHGVTRVDGTMAGLGRGAGNCPMELLLGLLRNPKFKIRPVWELIQNHFAKLQQELDWGPSPHYNMTGQMNRHPRSAIEARAGALKEHPLAFYDQIVADI